MPKSKAAPKLKFGDPPPSRERAPYDWASISEQLVEHPGEWAPIYEDDKHSYATAIRLGGIRALKPEHGFEVRTANNKRDHADGAPRTCDLWLRYNPEKDERN